MMMMMIEMMAVLVKAWINVQFSTYCKSRICAENHSADTTLNLSPMAELLPKLQHFCDS